MVNNKWFMHKGVFIVICICIVGAGVASAVLTHRSVNQTVASKDPKTIRLSIEKSMDTVGPQKTYDRIKELYKSEHFEFQHRVAHIFGEILFDKAGIQGITVCDGDFAFGCYHSFFGRAVSVKGPTIIKDLDQACLKKFGELGLGCSHGIGHGLGEYYGPQKLNEQLAMCAGLAWQGTLMGCQSGVFMEYNFPTQIGEDAIAPGVRRLDSSNPYAPCPSVPARFRRACYFDLASWWVGEYGNDYGAVGKLCEGIVDNNERMDCFRGIGYDVGPLTSYSVEKSRKACDAMGNDETKTLCKAGASWSFFADPRFRSEAGRMCQELGPTLEMLCRNSSDLLQG